MDYLRWKLCFRHCFWSRNAYIDYALDYWPFDKLEEFLKRKHKTIDMDQLLIRFCRRRRVNESRTLPVLKIILSLGSNPCAFDENGVCPFFGVVLHRVPECVEFFLPFITDVNQPLEKRKRKTALHLASYLSDLKILKLLLQKGANPNVTMAYGLTPLHLALSRNDVEIVRTLLEAGADVNIANEYGDPPLHWLCMFKHCHKLVHVLLEYDVDLSFKNTDGRTPLHHFVFERGDSVSICEKMLRKGSDPRTRDKDGNTPLHSLARKFDFRKPYQCRIVEVLVKGGCPVNAQNNAGSTALHWCADNNIIKPFLFCLMELGGRMDIRDNRRITPFGFICFIDPTKAACQIVQFYAVKERLNEYKFSKIMMKNIKKTDLIGHLRKCRDQLRLMASTPIAKDVNFTFFDLLTKPARVSVQYADNEELKEAIDKTTYKIYPIYTLQLYLNHQEALRRKEAEIVGAEFFRRVSRGRLNDYCIKALLGYIPIRSLEKMNRFFSKPIPDDAESVNSEFLHCDKVTTLVMNI